MNNIDRNKTVQKELRASRQEKDGGATLVEYSLLVALIAVVCFAAVQTVGSAVSTKYSTIESAIVPIMNR